MLASWSTRCLTILREPRVFQCLSAIQSLLLVEHEELADQIFALVRDLIELTMVEMEVRFLDLSENLGGVCTLEWKITANQRVEKDTKRPDVSLLAVSTIHNFRGHVVGCARDRLELTLTLGGLGQTEVDQAHRVVCSYHDIVGLDVAVDDVLCVTMIDSLEQTLHVPSCVCLREGLVGLLSDFLEELSARHVLHHQVDILGIVVRLVILHDVGVIERVKDSDFLHDAVNIIPQLDFIKHLNSNLEIRAVNVRSVEDTSEGANSKHLGVRVDVIVLL